MASAARKVVTVLFCDVVEFTAMGEELDPERLRRVMTRFFAEMQAVLEQHGGTVEKFIGDEVMAVFGVPLVHEDDALRAVRAAADMMRTLDLLNDDLERTAGVRLQIRIGVNTGEVVAGDHSAGHGFVTGDAVNLAKRLEQAAEPGQILIGKATYPLVRHAVDAGPLTTFKVKGKAEPVSSLRLDGVIAEASSFARRFDTPIVNRAGELAELHAAFDEAVASNSCRLVTLTGAPGIGKSRLVHEFSARVVAEATTLTGRCLAYGEGITYWPLVDIIRRATALSLVGGAGAGHSSALAARLQTLISGETPVATEDLMWVARRTLETIAESRPLVVCFEDIHWAEQTFLDLIEYIAGWARDAPILLICLARPELLEVRSAWATPQASARLINLTPLSRDETASLLDGLATRDELGAVARERVTDAAEGNPLFAEQMVAMLDERPDGDWTIPPSIHALLAARLDRLQRPERAVIEAAAVCGREFSHGAVATLTPPDRRGTVVMHLMALVRKGYVRPDQERAARDDDAFVFVHGLVRDEAYEGIAKEVRAELHERFATWLEQNAGERAVEVEEIVAYHLEQTVVYRQELGEVDERTRGLALLAGALLAATGRRALSRDDARAAVNLLTRAVALLPEDAQPRLEALPELGSALMRTGDFSRAEGILDEALDRAAAAGDKRLELRTLIEREFFRSFTDPHPSTEEIVRVAEAAIPLLGHLGDELGLAKAWWLLSEVHLIRCRWGDRAHALERALEHARRAGDGREVATIVSLLAQALYYGPTPVPEAIRRCEQFLADAAGSRGLEAATMSALAGLRAMIGEFDDARRLWASARRIYEDLGLTQRLASRRIVAATIELLAGDPAAAERELRASYDTLASIGATGLRATVTAFLGEAICRQARDGEAEALTVTVEEAAAADDVVTQILWRMTRAHVLARRGELEAAERLARDAVDLSTLTDYLDLQGAATVRLAEVLALAGADDAAAELVSAAKEIYGRKGNVVAAAQVDAVVSAVR